MDTGDILGFPFRGRVAILAMWMGLLLLPVLGHGQSWQWATYANSPLTDRGAGIDVDKRTGDVYVCGSASGALAEWGLPATTGTDGWVAKFKPNGTLRWAFIVSGAGNAELNDIVVDSATQRFYVTGTVAGMTTLTGTSGLSASVMSSAGTDIVVACFDSAGVMQWYAVEGGPGNDLGSGLAVDASGLYLSGAYQTSITLDGAVVSSTNTLTGLGLSDWVAARYNKTTGGLTWAVGNTAGNNTSRANAIATDPTGTDIYVVGGFSGVSQTVLGTLGSLVILNSNSGNFDMWACALRKTDGLARWGYAAGAASNDDEAFGVTSDAGAAFVSGRCQGNPTFAPLGVQPSGTLIDGFISRHNPVNGNAVWVNIMGSGGGADLQTVNDINPDGNGNLVFSGFFSGGIRLPSNASVTTTLSSAGGTDLLLACINPAGGLVWSTQGGAAASMDGSSECAAFDDKMAYVTGAYSGGASQFATTPVTNLPLAGQEDVLVAKYGLCNLYVNPVNTLSSPVPGICSGGSTTVDLSTSQNGAFYQLVDSATGLPVGLPVVGTGGFLSLPTGILNATTTFYVQGYFVNPACAEFLNDKVRIRVYPNPTVNIGPNITQCGGFGPLLDAGPGFSAYAWSTFQFTQTTIITSSGTYSVTVTDANGCQASDTMVYVFNALPTPNLGPDLAICSGNSTVLNPGGGYSAYAWSTGASTPTLSVSAAGTYTVTVTDANGCTNSDQIVISLNAAPSVNLGPDQSVCSGASATFNAGPGFNAYSWSTGATTSSISPTTSGTYTVTVTDGNGCTASDAAVLNVFANPTTTLGNDTAICTGSSLLIDAGPGFSGYLWTTGATTSTISVSAAGSYGVTVTDVNGCTGMSQINLSLNPLPTVNLGPDTSLCTGGSALLQAGPGFSAYNWSTGATTSSVTAITGGTYTVTVTDGNGCTASDSKTVTMMTSPTVSLGNDTTICPSDSILLQAPGGMSGYAWNTGATTPSIQAQASGNYEVTITAANGCQGSDTLVLSHLTGPAVNLGPDTLLCPGGSIVLNAGNPGSNYLWNGGATTQSITASTAGIFGVVVTDLNGCKGSDSVLVGFHTAPSVNLGPDVSICPGATYTFSVVGAFTGYVWNTGATTASITVGAAGSYDVTATDANGCQASDAVVLSHFALPVVALGNDTAICPLDSIGLDAGPGQSGYLWNSGAITQTVQVQAAGAYHVTVTDANGCQAADTLVISHLPYPAVNLGADTIACQGTTMTLDAGNPGSSYNWNTGATTQTISTSIAGTFAVTVTPALGCPIADTIDILFSPVPLPNLPATDTACIGDTLLIDPGTIVATYLWSTGDTTQVITVTQGGPYSVTVTDTLGCTASDSMNLVLLAPPVVGIGPDSTICQGDSLLLSVPNTGLSYLWSTGSTSNAIFANAAGPYFLIATDGFGCQGSDTMTLALEAFPVVLLGGDRTICAGDSIPLDAGNPGLTYQWSNGASSQMVFASQPATYTVTVSTAHGCTTLDSMTLQLQPLPTVNIGADTTICAGDSLTLLNSTGLSGNWSDGSSNGSIVATQSGWIWLQVFDNLGCSSRDSLLLTLQPMPVVSLSGLAPQYCLSDPAAQLIGQPSGGNFSGMASNNGLFTPSIAGTGNHMVVYSYTDSLGCPGSDSLSTEVVAPPSVADAGSDLFVNTLADLQAIAPAIGTGYWDIGAFPGQFSNPLSPDATAFLEGNGSYPFIWITENAPCPTSMDTVWVQFEGMHIPTGFSPNGDGVNDEYVIRGIEGFPNTRLQVLNRWGQVLWNSDDYQNDWAGQGSNGEHLVEDTYYLIVRFGEQEVSTYVVLKR